MNIWSDWKQMQAGAGIGMIFIKLEKGMKNNADWKKEESEFKRINLSV